jgi:hypothetical protein
MYIRCRSLALRINPARNDRPVSGLASSNAANWSQRYALHPAVDRLQGNSRSRTSHILPASWAFFRTDHTAAARLQMLICLKFFDISTSIYAMQAKGETYNPSQGKPGKSGES